VEAKALLRKLMNSENLEIEFQESVARINAHAEPFPADFLLRLYAYFKKATNNYERPSSRTPIINAFKTNALFQIKNISEDEAKTAYIELVNNYFLYRK
jgi:acyl-CoA-binding protein